ncbi:MAG: prepilin-type N-terminal cleavage/methylation domain-containing protein [Verrucomicrobiota bacterium]
MKFNYCISSFNAAHNHPRTGFSLVEMLTVLSIVSVLVSVSVVGFNNNKSGKEIRRAIVETTGFVSYAQIRASAMNTYVYVALSTANTDSVDLLMFESTTGLDAMDGKTSFTVNDEPDFVVSQPSVELKGIGFRDSRSSGTTYTPAISTLPTTGGDAISNCNITYRRGSQTITFDRLITFHPSGQVLNSGTYSSSMEFGFQEQNQAIERPNPVAFMISGLTGQVRIFRP